MVFLEILASAVFAQTVTYMFFCSVDPLLFPINSKNNKSGYESLAINLFEFKMINSVPTDNRLDRLDEGQGIAKTLYLHKARPVT